MHSLGIEPMTLALHQIYKKNYICTKKYCILHQNTTTDEQKKSLKSCMICCSQFECMGHIHKIIKSYCDLNTRWFLITLLSFNMKHCENEAGPSCALAVSEKIPAGSTHASVRPYGPNALWAPLKEKSMTAESQTFSSALKQDNKREREFITADLSWFHLCINMQQQKFSEKNLPINQSMLLLLKYSHERVKRVSQLSWSSVLNMSFTRGTEWV